MHHPTDRITHTAAFVTPVVEHWLEREIAQWVFNKEQRMELVSYTGARCSPVVRAYAHGAMGRRINPSW